MCWYLCRKCNVNLHFISLFWTPWYHRELVAGCFTLKEERAPLFHWVSWAEYAGCHPIESIKTTSMENVSTGVLEKIKNNIQEVKIKLKNDMMYQDIYNYICQNTKKNEDILSIMSNVQPNSCLKVDFQKVDQHAGGKWLIHDTKCRKDNQLQSLKLSCRISKLNS